MPSKIDRNADTHKRHQTNWQRLVEGAATFTIITDGTTISNSGGSLHVVSGGIGTTQLANDSVTFAKMQNIPTDTLIGRDTAGTGDPESIGVTGGIVFTGTGAIQTTAFTGDATKTLGGTVLTLATVNSNVGTFNNITINAKGLATAGSNVAYLTANQTITFTGDVTGSGSTSVALTIANGAVSLAKLGALTTKGDLLTHDGSNHKRQGVGNDHSVLVARSAVTNGIAWRNVYAINASVANSAISNTTTKTSIVAGRNFSSAEITDIAGGNSLQKGEAFATISCANAADTFTIFLSVVGSGGTIVDITSVVLTMTGTESNVPVWFSYVGGWSTDGATGTARGAIIVGFGVTAVMTISVPTATATTDTTGATNAITVYGQWSAARAGNVWTRRGSWAPFLSIQATF